MSEIVFTCECGKVYKFNRRFSGRTSRCIICKREYVVPLISEQINQMVPVGEVSEDVVVSLLSPFSHDVLPSGVDNSYSDCLSSHSSAPSVLTPSPSGFSKKPLEVTKPERIGKYEIREKIGSGGMGTVFYAWDTQLQRNVTIKTLNRKSRQHKSYKERFIKEARITGKLVHSGIIPIYALDYDDQREPYYVMRFLEGQTFEQLITQYHNLKGPLHTQEELRRLIRHFINACQTMAYVHDHHVVHRDIKPSNIMLSGYGETIILDWGLAKILTAENNDNNNNDNNNNDNNNNNNNNNNNDNNNDNSNHKPDSENFGNDFEDNLETEYLNIDLTLAGGRVGTLGFQSPEYLREGISRISDDIYALGVTLYYLLSNKLPYKLSRDHRGIFDILMTPPQPPHLHNTHVSRSLSAICLCALAFDKTKRYSSVTQLAADLQHWLDGDTVTVYRRNWEEKIELLIQKNALLLGVFFVAFGLGIFFTYLFSGQ
ncbi:MAG: serine/threonine protein kinase [Planctomycetaceae bacterium]|jgi:serine/threonine protein kinase|nr:serine/threonine protein kinase [Planctomycetaceae bacterium]